MAIAPAVYSAMPNGRFRQQARDAERTAATAIARVVDMVSSLSSLARSHRVDHTPSVTAPQLIVGVLLEAAGAVAGDH